MTSLVFLFTGRTAEQLSEQGMAALSISFIGRLRCGKDATVHNGAA